MTEQEIHEQREDEQGGRLVGALVGWLIIIVLIVLVALGGATAVYGDLDTTRKGFWLVVDDQGNQVSRHSEQDKAQASATNWAIENPGREASIVAPRWVTIYTPDEPVDPLGPPDSGPDPIDPPDPVDPPTGDRLLTHGNGFTGPTPQPGNVGGRDTVAIARWDVVPEQQVLGQFHVGVVAHHPYGMDRVEFSVEGGPWRAIVAPSENPRTGVIEYWATLNADEFDGWIEVRAVAYPEAGQPRVLPSLRLYAGENESLFPVLELDEGRHDFQALIEKLKRDLGIKANERWEQREGWLTIRSKAGTDPSKVIVHGNAPDGEDRHIRFQSLTRALESKWEEHYGRQDADAWWWFDNVAIIGNGADGGTPSRWIVHHSGRQYYNDCTIDGMQVVFQNATAIARNVVVTRAYEDFCRAGGLYTNITIKELDWGRFTDFHPDLFQWFGSTVRNFIAQDFTVESLNGQGLFSGNIRDSAFVRIDLGMDATTNSWMAIQMQGETSNVLVEDFTAQRVAGTEDIGATLRPDKGFQDQGGIVFRRSITPSNIDQFPGIKVED